MPSRTTLKLSPATGVTSSILSQEAGLVSDEGTGDDQREQGRACGASAVNRRSPVGREARDRQGSPGAGPSAEGGQVDDVLLAAHSADSPVDFPGQSPLFHAQHASRYDRQTSIKQYQDRFSCRLIVMVDGVFPDSVALIEDLIFRADPREDLHLLLDSPGGDGETAVRIIRSLQARCRELTVLIPNQAKSAATLLALGAHHIVMGPTSDLGPVDPQFRLQRGDRFDLVAAKDIIDAIDRAEQAVAAEPSTYPLHVSLLAEVTAVMAAQARSAIARTDDLVTECLSGCTGRSDQEVAALAQALHEPLIEAPRSHAAVFGARDARRAGLPVIDLDPGSNHWQMIWRLYTKYLTVPGLNGIYEGEHASQVLRPN